MLRACFSFFAGCLVYDLRLRSADRLKAPNLLEAGCLLLVIAFAVTTPSGGWQFAFPLAAMILIYVFSFDQGAISTVLRSSALQKLGLWSYSIYMIHTFIFHVMKMGVTFVAQKAKLDLVIWHNDEKLVLLGTPEQALLPALILSVVLVVPVAALTYRWIEKPAMDAARRGFSTTGLPALVRAQESWSASYLPRSDLALPLYGQPPGPALHIFERNDGKTRRAVRPSRHVSGIGKESPAVAGLSNVSLNLSLFVGHIVLSRGLVRSRTGARRLSGRRILVRRRRVVAPLRLRRGLSRRASVGREAPGPSSSRVVVLLRRRAGRLASALRGRLAGRILLVRHLLLAVLALLG